MAQTDDKEVIERDIKELHRKTHSLMLATLNEDGAPESSSAPYVMEDLKYYIFISGLAKHTRQLEKCPKAGALLIEDEADSKNVFARLRLSWNLEARFVGKDEELWNKVLDKMAQELGKTVDILRTLPDFRLIELEPREGRLVSGFGKAYSVDAGDLRKALEG